MTAAISRACSTRRWRFPITPVLPNARRKAARRGKLRGIAVGSYLEVTAPPSGELGKITFEPDGSVKLTTGTLDYGQGHATPFAQVLSAQLGVPFDKITLEQNDSDLVRFGNGTGGSRSITATGMAIVESSALVIAKGKQAAAHLMEASEGDIEFADGKFTIAGTDRNIGIMELSQRLREGKMPDGVPSSLDVDHATKETPSTFPNGCHVAEVEIDPETGITRIVRYTAVNDFGTVVNPMIVAGQLHGGVAQGIGQALMEEVSYDDNGQPITGSFMDYAMPRAEDIPTMEIGDHPSPAKSNPLGTKGCGEAGCAGSLVVYRQCGGRRAVRLRHRAYRYAADPGAGVARHTGCEDEGGVRIPPSLVIRGRSTRVSIRFMRLSRQVVIAPRVLPGVWIPRNAGDRACLMPSDRCACFRPSRPRRRFRPSP